MSIYTKTGDLGKTHLLGNKIVNKDHIRVESYGTIDELLSFLGLTKNYVNCREIHDLIQEIQNKLFVLCENLAAGDSKQIKSYINEEDIKFVEHRIDKYMPQFNSPGKFTIPGIGKGSGYMHVCRTICRRAERRIVTLGVCEEIDPLLIKYINRLSDLIYVLARLLEEEEIKYEG